jgi:signal peptidase I
LGHRFAPYLWAALFLLFSAIARYWRRVLEGAPGSRGRREALVGLATVAGAAAATFALRARVTEPYRVSGPSMLPTLEPDDLVAGNKLAYTMAPSRPPGRGDVVVFRSSAIAATGGTAPLPEVLVKRVVGLPGDRIRMRGNVPVINGWAVPTCAAGEYVYVLPDASGNMVHGPLFVEFLEDRAYLTVHAGGAPPLEEYVVKPGEVFVLGDNRGSSVDSRAFDRGRGGGVPFGAIEARAQWFLTGTHRDGESDWGRLLRPIDTMQARLRLEGLDTRALEDGIARCLSERPSVTRPPPSLDASARQISVMRVVKT